MTNNYFVKVQLNDKGIAHFNEWFDSVDNPDANKEVILCDMLNVLKDHINNNRPLTFTMPKVVKGIGIVELYQIEFNDSEIIVHKVAK